MLRIEGLGKRFKLYERPWHRLLEWLYPGPRTWHQDAWALRDVTLSVARGESLGIIGRNGSGKSTLLKILAGAMVPTQGTFQIRGRLLALLELGAGFHPELTGRQNVLVSSELLGFPPGHVRNCMADIESFAELGEYFDRPVKTYSSGMFVRLAFSTFMFLEPEILIVDEALSVGDVFFQQKCFGAVRRMLAGGTTLLYVSHDMATVCNLCDRVLFLDHGVPQFLGDPDEAVARYYATVMGASEARRTAGTPLPALTEDRDFASFAERVKQDSLIQSAAGIIGAGRFVLVAARVTDPAGAVTLSVQSGESLAFEMLAQAIDDIQVPNIGLEIYDRMNQLVFAISAINLGKPLPSLRRGAQVAVSFKVRFDLQSGQYTFALVTADQANALDPNTGTYQDRHHRLGPITVTWPRPLLPFYGITGLQTDLEVKVVGP